jgi:hypothetical protein
MDFFVQVLYSPSGNAGRPVMGEKFMRKAAPPEVVNRSSAGTNADSHAPPRESGGDFSAFICVDPEYAEQVYDYYNGDLPPVQERDFTGHLLICPYCLDVIHKLKWIDETLEAGMRAERDPEPPPAQSAEEGWEEKTFGNVF